MASSKRLARWSKGNPKRSYSGRCHPAPRPSRKRPPLISSMDSAILAMMPGVRNPTQATSAPIWMRLVAAAMPAIIVQHSQTPRIVSGLPSSSKSRWSANQTVSKPTASAVRAISSMSAKRGVPPKADSSEIGTISPSPIGRVESGQRPSGSPPSAPVGCFLVASSTSTSMRSRCRLVPVRDTVVVALCPGPLPAPAPGHSRFIRRRRQVARRTAIRQATSSVTKETLGEKALSIRIRGSSSSPTKMDWT